MLENMEIAFSEQGGLRQALRGLFLILTEGGLWPWVLIGLIPPVIIRLFSPEGSLQKLLLVLIFYTFAWVVSWNTQATIRTNDPLDSSALVDVAWSFSVIMPAVWIMTAFGFLLTANKKKIGILTISVISSLPMILLWAVAMRGPDCVFKGVCA